jgi:hypothetical protein
MIDMGADSGRLGPGTSLQDVEFEIQVNEWPATTFKKSYILPTGRTAALADGTAMYAAILDTTRVQLPNGHSFDATPSVSILDTPSGGQDVLVSIAFNNRSYNAMGRDQFTTQVTIHAGGETFHETHTVFVSCMDGDTPITLFDRTQVPIREIVRRELVLNPITGAAMEVDKLIRGPEPVLPTYRIGIGDTAVLFSSEHPIPVQGGLKVAREIVLGDLVMDADGQFRPVTTLEVVPPNPDQVVYNLQFIENSERWQDHVLLAGGMVVGDFWFQDHVQKETAVCEQGEPMGALAGA